MHESSCKQRKVRISMHTCIGCTSCACSPGSSRWAACTWDTAWCGPGSNSGSRSLRCSSGSMCALCRSPPANTALPSVCCHGMACSTHSCNVACTPSQWSHGSIRARLADRGCVRRLWKNSAGSKTWKTDSATRGMRPYFSPPRDVPKQIRLANGIRLIGCLPACEPPQCTGSRRRLRTCS